MEFQEKLQALRKRQGLTQEELAEILYVSRTAISKWESGRGYPNIDSLKAISRYFSVTIDDLLSGEELLVLAQEDQARKEHHLRDLVYGLLDCGAALFFFLPLFGQAQGKIIQTVSLLGLATGLKAVYMAAVLAMVLWGLLTLALQNYQNALWGRLKIPGSLGWNLLVILLFIFGRQPYGAALALIFFIIKALILVKQG